MYIPPFTISTNAINLIAEISAQIERYAIRLEQSDGLRLRKANRVRTIHSSLAIEGNMLSEDEVKDIIDGKTVMAPLRQIQEVKNAIKTYELYEKLNPFDVNDLLKAHGTMMMALTDDAGKFRRGGVGVFSEERLVHMAPPADRVPFLIDDLFEWLKQAKDHLLIRSCVFHYEFEFIHPFSDGNGRMGRLWQSLILGTSCGCCAVPQYWPRGDPGSGSDNPRQASDKYSLPSPFWNKTPAQIHPAKPPAPCRHPKRSWTRSLP